jgi:ankyrin repeat protein
MLMRRGFAVSFVFLTAGMILFAQSKPMSLEETKARIAGDPDYIRSRDSSDDLRTPLHKAAAEGGLGLVELLLGAGADIEAREIRGYTPLRVAAQHSQWQVFKLLLARGANINTKDDIGETGLIAAATGAKDQVEMLLAAGADVNVVDKRGRTALHVAAQFGQEEIAQLLLARGASVNAQTDDGVTPLHVAADFKREKIAELLLDHGAAVNARKADGATPLHDAAFWDQDDPGIVKLLVAHGADVNAEDRQGQTALSVAEYRTNTTGGESELSQVLLKAGAKSTDIRFAGGHSVFCEPSAVVSGIFYYSGNSKIEKDTLLRSGPNDHATVIAILRKGTTVYWAPDDTSTRPWDKANTPCGAGYIKRPPQQNLWVDSGSGSLPSV